MNFFAVSGRVGNDPQMRTIPSGTQVLNFSFAFDTGYKDKKATTWLSCAIWGQRADALKPYISKGMHLVLGGEISVRKWTDKDGKDGASLEMNVSQVTLPPKSKDSTPAQTQAHQGVDEETIPF